MECNRLLGKGVMNIRELRTFWEEEDAVGVVEIILILVGILTTYYGVSIKCIT